MTQREYLTTVQLPFKTKKKTFNKFVIEEEFITLIKNFYKNFIANISLYGVTFETFSFCFIRQGSLFDYYF